jgi:hypothetical protein
MAELADRLYKRKRIKDPNDSSNYVDIPVLYRAKIVIAADQYQEQWIYFDNSSASSRKVRIQKVQNTGQTASIDCERINSFFTKSAADQYQEHEWVLDNKDPPPIQQDGSDSPAHEKKHIVRYFRDNDASATFAVDCELIDELKIVLAAEQYQEYEVFTLNPELGDPIDDNSVPYKVTKGFCDPGLDLAPLDGLDPPYRLDPFQNIVNLIGSPWLFFNVILAGGDTGNINPGGPFPPQLDTSHVYSFGHLTGYEMHRAAPLAGSSSGTFTVGGNTYNYSGLANPSAGASFSDWTVCGFDIPEVPFAGLAVAVRAKASGSAYLHYPNDANPQPGWLDTLSITAEFLAWNGTGPFNVFGTVGGPQNPGMLTNATQAQFTADWVNTFPSQPNFSIYEFGDIQGSMSMNLSAFTVTSGSATWLPVAVALGSISLKDGFHLNNASFGSFTVLLKKQ